MPKIQVTWTVAYSKSGEKRKYDKNTVTIPRFIMKIYKWNDGDEIAFDFDKDDLGNDCVRMKRVR